MYASLMPDLIGVRIAPADAISLAARHGFAGVDLRLNRDDPPTANEADALRQQIADASLRPGYCSVLPNKLSADEAEWQEHRKHLEVRCDIAQRLGFTRACAVVLPFHETLPFDKAMDEHLKRLADVLPILADHGLTLGLEYVSPLTRRAGKPHTFVHDLKGMLNLFVAAGAPGNLGVMLDSFHWHCAGETAEDLRQLEDRQVVSVHVCDAIAGRPTDEQRVDERELPGDSGVIDLSGFMGELKQIGYTGPVSAEPTHPRWKAMSTDAACTETAAAVRRCVALADA